MGETLNELLEKLQRLCQLLETFSSIVAARSRPPVIDEESGTQAAPEGFSRFQHEVEREIQVLQSRRDYHQKLGVTEAPSRFSSNTPYLYAVGLEILAAPLPILAIGKSFSHDAQREPVHQSSPNKSGTRRREKVKVDVVTDNQWIRIVT
jgi:hypothetical protein